MSDGELAFSSFNVALRRVIINRCKISAYGGNLHPTQKPIALYSWLLQNYAKPGQSILGPHGGSFSSAISAYRMGFSYVGIEKDPDYFAAAVERFKKEALQMRLFVVPTPNPQAKQPSLIGIP